MSLPFRAVPRRSPVYIKSDTVSGMVSMSLNKRMLTGDDVSAVWATQNLVIEWVPGAKLVPVGDVFLPEELRVDGRVGPSGPTFAVVIIVSGGVPRCTQVELRESPECPEVRARDLAAVRLEDVLEAATSLAAFREDDDGTMRRVSQARPDRNADIQTIRAARSQTRRKVTPEVLAEVADLYRAYFDDSPIERIATAFQVSERTAARYVQLCRRDGRLPQTVPGKKAK